MKCLLKCVQSVLSRNMIKYIAEIVLVRIWGKCEATGAYVTPLTI